ncbi:SMP-30/gluconolactonase/LRE family protein [Actinoplanes sp. NPDC051861]|uniref:SMP-30/gluconolactonase/LRE family protein n=1 Tax=Actinoplanes sp. NPDC051861 TaxID=3155170 RepID=UPI0034194343
MTRRMIHPKRWRPPAIADGGPTAPLQVLRKLPTGGPGPEDVVFDSAGNVLCGTGDGRIVRIDPSTGERTVLASTGGRPLGLHARSDGGVLVCDHDRGLLAVSPTGDVTVLAEVAFPSNVVETSDGTVWFTSSSTAWDLAGHLGDVFEHSCTGRLLRRDPDGTVTTVLDGLKFANGLVLAPDESHLLFAETAGYRVQRHWIGGDTEVVVDNLPGFPDNMYLGSDGLLWVGIAAPRNALLDRLLPLPGFLRLLVWNLPEAVRPKAVPIAWAMAFEQDGTLVHDLRSSDGSYGFVTSAAERNGVVVLGSLTEPDLAITSV